MAEPINIISDSEDEVEFVEQTNPFDVVNDDDTIYFAKRTKQKNERIMIAPWKPCRIVGEMEDGQKIVEYFDSVKHTVAMYELAKHENPKRGELKRGTRVIAARRNVEILDNGERIPLNSGSDKEPYPGINVGHFGDKGYLIFFDDGFVQYVPRNWIRRVLGNDGYQHAHPNAKPFFEFYFNQKDLMNLKMKDTYRVGQYLKFELNGKWIKAEIKKEHGSLIFVYFEAQNHYEWFHLGSPRISKVYRHHTIKTKSKAFDKLIGIKSYSTSLSVNDDVLVIDLVEPDDDNTENEQPNLNSKKKRKIKRKHTCDPKCLRVQEDDEILKYTALQRPLIAGWVREVVDEAKRAYYKAPCGEELRTYNEIHKYLTTTESKLRIDCFSFDKQIEIPKISKKKHNSDISRGVEDIPIGVRNSEISLAFKYITDHNFEYIDEEIRNNLGRRGCNCEDGCRDKLKCSCWRQTVDLKFKKILENGKYKRKTHIGYENMKLLKELASGIVECGGNCKCCADKKCSNSVVQNGIQHKLEVFKTANKGWGVKTTTDLPPGAFICHYAGDVLEVNAADKRDTSYQFKLSHDDEDDRASDSEDYSNSDGEPPAKKQRREEDDDVRQIILNYFPPMELENNLPDTEIIELDEEKKEFVIDSYKNGNISRFVNHSCEPNMFSQKVYVGDDKRFPYIAFFAAKMIKAGEEITINYNYTRDDDNPVACHCGTNKCSGRLV